MASDATYNVFLSYASRDKPAVEDLAYRLKAEGLKPFLDKWHLVSRPANSIANRGEM